MLIYTIKCVETTLFVIRVTLKYQCSIHQALTVVHLKDENAKQKTA